MAENSHLQPERSSKTLREPAPLAFADTH